MLATVPKTQFVSVPAAVQDILRGQAIPVSPVITSSDAAVIAVIFAVICKFNQPPDENFPPIDGMPDRPGAFKKIFGQRLGASIDQNDEFLPGKDMFFFQFADQKHELIHKYLPMIILWNK